MSGKVESAARADTSVLVARVPDPIHLDWSTRVPKLIHLDRSTCLLESIRREGSTWPPEPIVWSGRLGYQS